MNAITASLIIILQVSNREPRGCCITKYSISNVDDKDTMIDYIAPLS